MSYSLGKDVSTVVHTPDGDRLDLPTPDGRMDTAGSILSAGYMLRAGDIWNGQPVTEETAKVFVRPSVVSFIAS